MLYFACACVCFSRIVSESKALVNGIDICLDQTLTPDESKMENNSLTEQSNSLCLPPAPSNSPVADSTEANVHSSSWFAGLTTVVDSPNSYPKWRDNDAAVSSVSSVTSCGEQSSQSLTSAVDMDDSELEPPAKKRQLLQQTSLSAADDRVSTTAAVTSPLLGQLLSSTVEDGENQSHNDDDADDDDDDGDVANHCPADSSNMDGNTDLTCVSSADSVNDVQQHEGLLYIRLLNGYRLTDYR